jgi:uncharacterized protein (TIGR02266 family)
VAVPYAHARRWCDATPRVANGLSVASAAVMIGNKRDSVEVPIELSVRKVRSEKEEPLQLTRLKQRSLERLRVDVELSVWSESHFYAGLTDDVSQTGLFVATYRPLRPGESILLRVQLFGESIEVEGVIRWRRAASEHAPPGVGVGLGDLPANARRLIDAFCAERPPIYYDFENDDDEVQEEGRPSQAG